MSPSDFEPVHYLAKMKISSLYPSSFSSIAFYECWAESVPTVNMKI